MGDLLTALLVNNEAGRDSIHSYTAVCDWRATTSVRQFDKETENLAATGPTGEGESVLSIATIVMKRSGSSRFVRKTEQQSVDGRESVPHVRELVGVMNPEFTAFSVVPGVIEQHFHESLHSSSMSEREKIMTGFLFNIEPIEMAYDTTSGTLSSIMSRIGELDGWRIDVKQIENRNGQYKLIAFHPSYFQGVQPEREYIVNGTEGFTLSSLRFFGVKEGVPRISRDVESSEISPGLWFPRVVSLRKGGATCELSFRDIELNRQIEKGEFLLEALGMNKAGVKLIRYRLDGVKEECAFRNGTWSRLDANDE